MTLNGHLSSSWRFFLCKSKSNFCNFYMRLQCATWHGRAIWPPPWESFLRIFFIICTCAAAVPHDTEWTFEPQNTSNWNFYLIVSKMIPIGFMVDFFMAHLHYVPYGAPYRVGCCVLNEIKNLRLVKISLLFSRQILVVFELVNRTLIKWFVKHRRARNLN